MYVEHLRIPVGEASLHAERLGRGSSAVVLVHGFGTNASLWRPVAARLANHGYVAISPDLLGHGESDRPLSAVYDLASHADVLDLALASLRIGHAVVVGQDVGALVALALASRHPSRVDRLVMVNPPDISELPPAPVRAMLRASSRLSLGVPGTRLGATAMVAALLEGAVVDPAGLPAAATARYLAPWASPGGVDQLRVLARTLADDSMPVSDLSGIRTRTLIIRGERDRSVSPAVAAQLAATLPNARLISLPAQGRILAEDAPESLSRLLITWIRGEPADAIPA